MNTKELSNKEIEDKINELNAELHRRDKHVGCFFEAYWHSTHEQWAVRLKTSIDDLWVGMFDKHKSACDTVDKLDEAVNTAQLQSKNS